MHPIFLLSVIGFISISPTVILSALFLYADIALGYSINPEYIVGGIFVVVMLSLFILWRAANKIYELIVLVPQLSFDVTVIKDDIGEIKDTVKGLLPWKNKVDAELAVIRYRLGIKENEK